MLKIRNVLLGGVVLSGAAALCAVVGAQAFGAGESARSLSVSRVHKVDEQITTPEYDQLALADVTIGETKIHVHDETPHNPMP